MSNKQNTYTFDFIRAVYPDQTDLIAAFGSEEECLRDATKLIRDQRHTIGRLVDILLQSARNREYDTEAALQALGLTWGDAIEETNEQQAPPPGQ